MQMNEVVSAYRTARTAARRRSTVQLSWQESRARGRAHDHDLDEYQLARFAAVRAELRARGREVPPLVPTVRWFS
jgi:uncharacterized protein YcbK (DUF882 family)